MQYIFLPVVNKDYNLKTNQFKMDFNSGEVAEKRNIIDKKIFIKGRQDTLEDGIATIANMDSMFAFMTDYLESSQAPDNSKMVKESAVILSTQAFKNFYEKYKTTFPCVPYTLLCVVQLIFSSFAHIATDHLLQRKLVNGESIPVVTYEDCCDIFED